MDQTSLAPPARAISQTWQRFTCTFTTGATISGSNIFFQKSGASAYNFYLDNIVLQPGQYSVPGTLQIYAPITSAITYQNSTNSTNAFQIQNAAGTSNLFVADTTNTRIGIGGLPANGVLTIGTNTQTASGGLYFGTDTNLYRSGSSQLKTDGSFAATGVDAGAGLLQGSLGLTVSGAAASINVNSNFNTNINSGSSTGLAYYRQQRNSC
jgi:hypothetical protein